MNENVPFFSLKSPYIFPLHEKMFQILYREVLYDLPPHSSLDSSFTNLSLIPDILNDFSLLVISPADQLFAVSGTSHSVCLARKILAPDLGMNDFFSSFRSLLRNLLRKSSLSTITYHFLLLCYVIFYLNICIISSWHLPL